MFQLSFIFLLTLSQLTDSRSLVDVVCTLNSSKCRYFKEAQGPSTSQQAIRASSERDSSLTESGGGLGAPSRDEFNRWQNYERDEAGTGLHPDSGPGFGPGMGDVEVRTGVGIQYPYGNVGIRRDFGLFMGGSGRSGGHAFGWGNGQERRTGAAPWAWP